MAVKNIQNKTADSDTLWISVVITTYNLDRYNDFKNCVESILSQQYESFDVVLVSDSKEIANNIDNDFSFENNVTHTHLEESGNLSTARNAGASVASGDVIAFIDDDAVAGVGWLEEIAEGYDKSNLAGVGGPAEPDWVAGTIDWLPSEFYWLVGVTHRGFPESEGEVRNTFGCNISFDAETFETVGGFDDSLGKNHGHNLQGEETDLCNRIKSETGQGIFFNPNANIKHKVYDTQTKPRWLFNRAYWQGVTKARLSTPENISETDEETFLKTLFTESLPRYARGVLFGPNRKHSIEHLFSAISLTGAVGIGFVWGKVQNALRSSSENLSILS